MRKPYSLLQVFALLLFCFNSQLNAQTTQVFTSSGTFTAPPCVTSVQVQSWGGGGGGAGSLSGFTNNAGGGGGGGGYTYAVIAVVPGNTYTVTVGAGGTASSGSNGGNGGSSSFNGSAVAAGGFGGTVWNSIGAGNGNGGSGGAGGTYSGGSGTGGDHPNSGGGGGGGAGSGGNGGDAGSPVAATPGTAGPGTQPGGAGGSGGSSGGIDGFAPGGGGGGALTLNPLGTSQAGGKGADGQIIITYTSPTPTITNATGPACGGGTITITGTNLNGATSVTINGTAVINPNVSATTITGTIAPGTTSGTVSVTTPCGTANSSLPYTIQPPAAPVSLGQQTVCAGGSFSFGGHSYTAAGTYYDTTASTITGCDSITSVTLSISAAITQSISQTICQGSSISFGGHNYSSAGSYIDTSTSTVSGCDSITTLTLSVSSPTPQVVTQSICNGNSYLFNGTNYSLPGTYSDTLPGAGVNGCDSIVILNLSINAPAVSSVVDSICQGGSYQFNGNSYTTAGTYVDTLIGASSSGCDSIVTLILSIKSGATNSVVASATSLLFCPSDSSEVCATPGFLSYNWNTGDTSTCFYTRNAGNYYVTAIDVNGCTYTSNHLSLNTYPAPSISLTVNGDTLQSYGAVSYQWYLDNQPIPNATNSIYIAHQTGYYVVEIADTNGCHSRSSATHIVVAGIFEQGITDLISIYPNPTNENGWTISAKDLLPESTYELFDEGGRLIKQGIMQNTIINIQGNFAPGIYILQIKNGQLRYTAKLVRM